jgi:hypothetical protein
MTVKQSDAEQNEPEEDKIERNSKNQKRIGHRPLNCSASTGADPDETAPAKKIKPGRHRKDIRPASSVKPCGI